MYNIYYRLCDLRSQDGTKRSENLTGIMQAEEDPYQYWEGGTHEYLKKKLEKVQTSPLQSDDEEIYDDPDEFYVRGMKDVDRVYCDVDHSLGSDGDDDMYIRAPNLKKEENNRLVAVPPLLQVPPRVSLPRSFPKPPAPPLPHQKRPQTSNQPNIESIEIEEDLYDDCGPPLLVPLPANPERQSNNKSSETYEDDNVYDDFEPAPLPLPANSKGKSRPMPTVPTLPAVPKTVDRTPPLVPPTKKSANVPIPKRQIRHARPELKKSCQFESKVYEEPIRPTPAPRRVKPLPPRLSLVEDDIYNFDQELPSPPPIIPPRSKVTGMKKKRRPPPVTTNNNNTRSIIQTEPQPAYQPQTPGKYGYNMCFTICIDVFLNV